MAYNNEMIQTNLDEINLKVIKKAILLSYRDGITQKAPLGSSGDDIILFGQAFPNRVSLVSIRSYNNSPQMLITDKNGRFIFYGTYHIGLGIDFIVKQFMQVFKLVKFDIQSELPGASTASKQLESAK